ncbi:MAG: hypothetical protein PVI86_15380 [Phycisphaerae bacterium]|jgi:hypothetical protein
MQPESTEFAIGQCWTITYTQCKNLVPPHVEDVEVSSKQLKSGDADCASLILQVLEPWTGSPDVLFDGRVGATGAGRGYVSKATGIPKGSVGFWTPDRKLLRRTDDHGRKYYRYSGQSRVKELRYVGFDDPVSSVERGTLIRVSLATWWRPEEAVDLEERCYLQLSGWY